MPCHTPGLPCLPVFKVNLVSLVTTWPVGQGHRLLSQIHFCQCCFSKSMRFP
uniref:Uncharacterized protein n=1 Tax=Anguilla anguilla TaxID=7936 RepID=A0A0E9PVB5_ANGAN